MKKIVQHQTKVIAIITEQNLPLLNYNILVFLLTVNYNLELKNVKMINIDFDLKRTIRFYNYI